MENSRTAKIGIEIEIANKCAIIFSADRKKYIRSMGKIKNVIFDLGGVFIDLDFNKTKNAFESLGVNNYAEMFNQHHADDLFLQLETGKISEVEFYAAFRKLVNVELNNEQIKNAWNAMLLHFNPKKIEWLQTLREDYKLFLFSNTNIIHQKFFEQRFIDDLNGAHLQDYFEKVYYSQEIGMRKPNKDGFEFILNEQQLDRSETLFIDDTIGNVETAKSLGLQTFHLTPDRKLQDVEVLLNL
ncbi:HAD family hydrolase [Rhizosphaericola mali]|uniref:HAD family phosphatase n=1 Tax=Rhizosphaericola mali TaxID=2545455 RepID=A0A5P2G4Z2_9BACT|nr:HAD family phosphatase [Rhizosphaericola mali]QES89758.1 HAD family phosphatase [Rhizosphaericola mali]